VFERMSRSVAQMKGAVAEEESGAHSSGLPYKIRPTVAVCGELTVNCICLSINMESEDNDHGKPAGFAVLLSGKGVFYEKTGNI